MSKRGVTVHSPACDRHRRRRVGSGVRLHQLIRAERAAAGTLTYDVRDLTDMVVVMEGAQRGYIASGISPVEWYGRVTRAIDVVDARIAARRAAAT
jgi:hypothetical protein